MTSSLGPAPVWGAGPAASPTTSAGRMRAVVRELADPRYAGRRVGTAGGHAAARWLADYLTSPAATVRTDSFFLPGGVREVYATPTLSWGFGDTTSSLTFRREFCEHLASADRPAVHRGRLARADRDDVAGAWVLAPTFSPEQIGRWAATGAAGVLLPRGVDDAGWMPKLIAGPAIAALPILAVRADVHAAMVAACGSGTAWAAGSAPVRPADVTGVNVYGEFRGRAADGLAILLTAHFDGVGDDPDGTRFPAAADNASGVAVVLEAAHQLDRLLPPEVGLTVALLDAEEVGAHGSAHHAQQVKAGTYVVNVDGAAALHEAAAVEAGGPARPLLAALDQAGRATGIALAPRSDAVRQSPLRRRRPARGGNRDGHPRLPDPGRNSRPSTGINSRRGVASAGGHSRQPGPGGTTRCYVTQRGCVSHHRYPPRDQPTSWPNGATPRLSGAAVQPSVSTEVPARLI